MQIWYAYINSMLVSGRGNVIRTALTSTPEVTRVIQKASAEPMPATITRIVPPKTFAAALISGFALQALSAGKTEAAAFTSVNQLRQLLGDDSIEQTAINLLNGRALVKARVGGTGSLVERVTRGFLSGDLLFLPRDRAYLHTSHAEQQLPGMVVFLLAKAQTKSNAFAGYLRRGTSPTPSAEMIKSALTTRPVLRTWERELRLERAHEDANA